jgi:uncharacterized protein with HEPN domain
MSQRDVELRLRHMLDAAREARQLTADRARAEFDDDRTLKLAIVRLLEVLGEAAARVPEDFRSRHPRLPWAEIVGLRNRLIHGYYEVDYDVVWQILQEDLPPLVERLSGLVKR